MSKRTSSDPIEGSAASHNYNKKQKTKEDDASTAAGSPIPAPFMVTRWLSSEIPKELPLLPRILNPELEKAVFTHPGLGETTNYERLEWVGDAYLELIASNLISQTFTRTPSGRCSQLREILIRNITLADYFRQYELPSRARLPGDIREIKDGGRGGKSKDKDLVKTQGDMFEAYVAAAIMSDPINGLSNTVTWLKALFGRTLKDQILENEQAISKSTADPKPKETLRAMIGAKGIYIEYRDMGETIDKTMGLPLYRMGCYLDGWGEKGKLLGIGTALKKQEAAAKAAIQAMENKKLMKVYEAKKKAYKEAELAASTQHAN